MKKIIDEMKDRLQADLAVCGEEVNPLKRMELSKQAALKAIGELERLLETSSPLFSDDLIRYNKVWAPPFYGKLILFEKCLHVEALKLSYARDELSNLFAHEMISIDHFFRRHGQFCQHYYSGSTEWDPVYFGRMDDIYLEVEDIPPALSGKQNRNCLLVAHILAYEEYRTYLISQGEEKREVLPAKRLVWKGSHADLIEMASALAEFIEKDGKLIPKSELIKLIEGVFGISIKGSGSVDNRNRNRKKDPAAFLTKLKERYLKRADELDDARYPT